MRVPRPVRLLLTLAVAVQLAVAPGLAAADPADSLPFRDPRLPLETRISDLMSRLTLDERIAFLHQYQPEIPRLGIKLFKNGTEALHGLAWSNNVDAGGAQTFATATVFPQAIGLASTWDPALIRQVGSAVGDEARGYNSLNSRIWGTNLWAPVVNLLRDPRWGRNEEGYSEDPLLTGAISSAYGKGMEGDDPRYLKAAPTLKHYLANNNEIHRDITSSMLPQRVLHEYDEQAFRPAIAAGAATGVMTSYNLVNGRPNTVSPDVDGTVRGWTDKPLMAVTDAFAPGNLTGSQQYYATQAEADAAAIKAGLDSFTDNDTNSSITINAVKSALAQGLLTEADVNDAVRHVLSIRFRLGDFDPDGGPYARITAGVINSPAHRQLARRTAGEAMVLLKNARGALPLSSSRTRKVAVVGPLENTLYTDWYSGTAPYKVTPLDGIRERLGAGATVTGSEGVDRIALKDPATGRYVTAGAGPAGGVLAERATSADATTQFDAFDWGQGVLTLRSVANGKYLGYNFSDFRNDQAQPNGWFVQQQFKLERRPSGNYVIHYAGYETQESWFNPNHYLTLQPDGTLNLGAATADAATEFSKEVVSSGQDSAVAAARGADAAVVVVGSMPFINGREAHDRTSMALAEGQEALVKAVHAANPNTIVVLENSYPDTITWEQDNLPAILWTSHAGQETGHALADVLFGDVNPAGRLTQTWYRSDADLPDILDYDIISSDRTYLYFRGAPLYPFGHGLSYTTFRYSNLRLSSGSVGQHGSVTVSVDVRNAGSRAGDEVVQLYTHQHSSRDKQPLQQLRGFQRVHLAAGQTRTVRLRLNAADLAHWDVTRGRWVVESSVHDVMVGASSADIRARAALRVNGERIPPRDLTRPTRAESFDSYRGVTLVDESKARGTAVGAGADGQWIGFADADLRSGVRRLTARAARASAGDAAIQVRLDDPVRGPLVGAATVASTGDKYTYATTTAPLRGARGRHDVYLVLPATSGSAASPSRPQGAERPPPVPEGGGMFRSRKIVAAAALVAGVSLALAACGGGGSSGNAGGGQTTPKVLKLWHYEGADSAMGVAWAEAIKQFKATHPGVEVKFEAKGFEQIRQSANLILNSDDVPDIMEYNKGNASAGLLSKQGLLTDLTSEVTRRGWDKLISPGLQTTARYDADGVMGGDKWYGVPNYAEYVMVFYNKDMFAKQGVQVPTTLAEFEAVMDKFVKAGITPLSVGGAEYPAQQIFYELALSKATRSFVDDFELYKNKVNFHGPEFTFAANTFSDWVKKGYIAKNSAGIKAQDMGDAFQQGKFPMVISGSWWFGTFASQIKKFKWGTFLFPGNRLHPASSGNIWVVPAKAKAKSLAYDFIDITMKPEIQTLLGNSGGVPVAADASKITDPNSKELIQNFNTISSQDGLAFYPDWPAPGYYDVLVAGVQELINGTKSPDQVLTEIAKPYNDNLADLGK